MADVSWVDAVEGVRRIVGRDLQMDPESLELDDGLAALGASSEDIARIWRHLDAHFGFSEILRSPIADERLDWLALTVVNTAEFDDVLGRVRRRFAGSFLECERCGTRYSVMAAIQTMAERIRTHQYLYSFGMLRALKAYVALYEANVVEKKGLTLRQLYSRIAAKKAAAEETLETLRDLGLIDDGYEEGKIWVYYLCPITQEEVAVPMHVQVDETQAALSGVNGNLTVTLTADSTAEEDSGFEVIPPQACPSFADVGGLDDVKAEISGTIGLLLRLPEKARELGIEWNGLILHGPPGSGKTFLAKATAGEFGCSFIQLGSAELIHALVGESAKTVAKAFEVAEHHAPCILFFDELESLAGRRDSGAMATHEIQTLSALLKGMDRVRERSGVQVLAATNSLDLIDPALVRAGRFDLKIRLDVPDRAARIAIVTRLLAGRASDPNIDAASIADATEDWSASRITSAVNLAALNVLGEIATGTGAGVLTQDKILAAVKATGARDRPLVAGFHWDDLILSESLLGELKQLQRLIEAPERAKALGIEMPRGALLYGPPGTGKTTIARVLAAEAHTSFYPEKGSDLVSMWLGQSSRNIANLFARARENAPSVVFIDEFDAIAGTRGSGPGSSADRERDSTVNQLLQEIDGLVSARGVFVLAATNRPDILDRAILRGGRLARQIEVPLPNQPQRHAMLQRFTGQLLIDADVSLRDISYATDGFSGADLNALCQQAAIAALVRTDSPDRPVVTIRDFHEALSRGHDRLAVADFSPLEQ